MADLSGIIRFRKWELDEKRRELAVLFEERNAIEHRIELLDQEMLEQQSMKDSDIGSVTLGAYIEGARKSVPGFWRTCARKTQTLRQNRKLFQTPFEN